MIGQIIGSSIGGIAGAGAALAGQASQARAQRETNRMNVAENLKNREFQERMSSSSHQREVADLRAAGLNPILSAGGGGSSSPSGSVAVQKNPEEGKARAYADAVKSTISTVATAAQVKLLKEQTGVAKANRGIAEAAEYSAKNQKNFEQSNPEAFGQLDALGKRVGPMSPYIRTIIMGLTGLQHGFKFGKKKFTEYKFEQRKKGKN